MYYSQLNFIYKFILWFVPKCIESRVVRPATQSPVATEMCLEWVLTEPICVHLGDTAPQQELRHFHDGID